MQFTDRVENLVLSGFQALYVPTTEENRCEEELQGVASAVMAIEGTELYGGKMSVITWDSVAGFSWFPQKSKNIQDPIEALLSLGGEVVENDNPAAAVVKGVWGKTSALFVFRDFHEFLKDPGVRRAFRNLVEKNRLNCPPYYRRPIIVLSPFVQIPDGVKHCLSIVKFDPPGVDRLTNIFQSIMQGLTGEGAKNQIKCPPELQDRVVQAMLGLREREAEDTLAFGLRVCRGLKPELVDVIEDQKATALEKSEILRYIPKDKISSEADVAGYGELKDWLNERKLAFTPQARKLKIDPPKGIVLLGVPGTFKTGVGKIIARILGYPLIFFNVARVGAQFVGESQRRMEEALQTVDIIDGSVLLIDDADKIFAGVTSGLQGDSGTRQQTFGQLLVWLTEHTSRTFVVMTMNRVAGIPEEFLRKGRFDEIFVTGLPDTLTIEEIIKIHLRKRNAGIANFSSGDLIKLAESMRGFVGAEIEQAIIDARFMALKQSNLAHANPTVDELIFAASRIKPMSQKSAEAIEEMALVCEEQGRSVEKERPVESTTDKRTRRILTG
jgi:ATP-dependent 26S proteasome regulatory subunit